MIKTLQELDDFFISYMPKTNTTGELRGNRLKRMERLLEVLGNPERSFKSIHIAGSKGKGTSASLLSSAINEIYKTGLYRSPHVYDLRERFSISGEFFSLSMYLRVANELKEKVDNLDFLPTTFELYTAYAYMLFKESGCEYAVIETGLGGRLDATNTLDSIMEILLPIELEHQEVLGDTIEKIAVEKSKIIKKDSLVVVADQDAISYSVFEKEAKDNGCPFFSFKNEISSFSYADERNYSITSFEYKCRKYEIKSKIRGKESAKSIATVAIALDKLDLLSEKSLSALARVKIEGRFEERCENGKAIVLDSAHTKNSMNNLISSFKELYDTEKTCVLFSALEKKDIEGMLKILLSTFNTIVITKAGSFKKSDADKIYESAMRIKRNDQMIYLIKNEKEALSFSKRLSDIILITGSFYLIGQFGVDNA